MHGVCLVVRYPKLNTTIMNHYVITGSIGHISKPVIEGLVKAGKKVSVITSNPDKIKEIEASGAKLASLGIAPSAIVSTLSATNTIDRAGSVENTAERVNVRVSGAFTSPESIREMGTPAGDPTSRRETLPL
jgi:hypothetical protein